MCRGCVVPVSSSVHPGVYTHVQLRSRINDLLKLRPLVTASHTWRNMTNETNRGYISAAV